MADSKISALPAASTPLAGTEVLPIVQGGITEQVSVANLTAGRAVGALSLTTTQAITGGSLYQVSGFSAYRANGASISSPGDASMYFNTTTGQTFQARAGASYDWSLINPGNANYIARVPTGTLNFEIAGGNLAFSTSGKGIAGTTTNDNADAGIVGQFVTSSVATATLTTAAADIASISLTAGDWDVTYIASSGGVGATCTAVLLSINTTSATVGTQVDDNIWVTADPINGLVGGVFTKRLSLSATTTVYGISRTVAGTVSVFQAKITARRRR